MKKTLFITTIILLLCYFVSNEVMADTKPKTVTAKIIMKSKAKKYYIFGKSSYLIIYKVKGGEEETARTSETLYNKLSTDKTYQLTIDNYTITNVK